MAAGEGDPARPVFDASAIGGLAPSALFSRHGRGALVTGAAGGIGRWLAAGLGAAGAAVVVSDVDTAGLGQIEETLRAAGIDVAAVVADLGDESAPRALVDGAVAAFGGLHIVVNNAAVNRR